jgi:predicted dehydrogenase
MSKPRLALIGCGYWGQKLLRSFMALRKVEVKTICDFELATLAQLKRDYPTLQLEPDYRTVLSDARIDAVVIATPASTHYIIGRKALLAGKHVLVEPPIATMGTQALELIDLAEKRSRVLMVDHTFIYTGAAQSLKQWVENSRFGELLYFDSLHISPGLLRSDLNVLWDLGVHDFSLLDYLCAGEPISVTASGSCHLSSCFENISFVSAAFKGRFSARFHLNWLSPIETHRVLLGGSRAMIVFEEEATKAKLTVHRRNSGLEDRPSSREKLFVATDAPHETIDVAIAENVEPLAAVAQEFTAAILQQRTPIADGEAGYRVVRLLEAAQRSMTQSGRTVELGGSAALARRPGKVAVV